MKYFSEAKDLVFKNLFDVLKIFAVEFILGLLLQTALRIPILGVFLGVVITIYSSVVSVYLVNGLIIENEKIDFVNCFIAPFESFKKNWSKVLLVLLIIGICTIPLFLFLFWGLFGVAFVSVGHLSVESGLFFGAFMLLVLVFIILFIGYIAQYKISSYIVETSDASVNVKDSLIMALCSTLIYIIPIIGIIINVVLGYIYRTKIILDLKGKEINTDETIEQ